MEKNSLVAAPGRQPGRRDRDGQAVQAQVWEEEQGEQSNVYHVQIGRLGGGRVRENTGVKYVAGLQKVWQSEIRWP